MRIGAEIGLSLNVSKCELIAHSDAVISDTLLQSFNRVEIDDATLLGAPLFPSQPDNVIPTSGRCTLYRRFIGYHVGTSCRRLADNHQSYNHYRRQLPCAARWCAQRLLSDDVMSYPTCLLTL